MSQHEVALPIDYETIKYVAEQVGSYIRRNHYHKVILLNDHEAWGAKIASAAKSACKNKKISVKVLNPTDPWDKLAVDALFDAVQKAMGERK